MNHQEKDRKIFRQLIRVLGQKQISEKSGGPPVLEIGKLFLGTPYAEETLEAEGKEHLVINLRGFDCVTFIENVIALAGVVGSKGRSFTAFQVRLRKIRYRRGQLKGYASRLHYFSDWIFDNQKKGTLKDLTARIGGKRSRKAIHFMTTHADLYPPLKEAVNLKRTRSVEKTVSRRSFFFIPKGNLKHSEDRIRDGDLIAITTNVKGLDVQHVGFAVRVKNRIHLLHASSQEGRVVISKETLYRYLMTHPACVGIRVARLL